MSALDQETFLRTSFEKTFPKGATIHGGNECTGVILVRSGSLRVYMLSGEGKEITLYRLFAGDLCILSASCVLDAITFDVFVDAEEMSECVIVGGCAFEDVARRLPDAKIFALEMAVSRFSDVMWMVEQVLWKSFDKRLAAFLLEEAVIEGTNVLKITHEIIGNHLGNPREVVTRMLRYFQSEGWVSLSRGMVEIVDEKGLRALCE